MRGSARAAALGLAGWVVRLMFATGAAIGAVGLYIALFASLGSVGRGHEWRLGLAVAGCGTVLASVGFAAACRPGRGVPLPGSARSRAGWYAGSSVVFAVAALGLLCLSSGLRLTDDWRRATVTVQASVFDCTPVPNDGPGTANNCTYTWQWRGAAHSAGITGHASYPDGSTVEIRIDPTTGESSDGGSTRLWLFVLAMAVGVFDLIVCGFLAEPVYRLRWWLGSWAWWNPPQSAP